MLRIDSFRNARPPFPFPFLGRDGPPTRLDHYPETTRPVQRTRLSDREGSLIVSNDVSVPWSNYKTFFIKVFLVLSK